MIWWQSFDFTESSVVIKNLNFSYKNKQILKDFNLEIFEKEIYVLLGNNGSGKSTLFNILTNQTDQNYTGSIQINGISLHEFQNWNQFWR